MIAGPLTAVAPSVTAMHDPCLVIEAVNPYLPDGFRREDRNRSLTIRPVPS